MGMTLYTLAMYWGKEEIIGGKLAPTDEIRRQNQPWLVIVPDGSEKDHGVKRLRQLAKSLSTLDDDTALLLFSYLDDDAFALECYQRGKRTAKLYSDESFRSLGKVMAGVLGDDSLPKRLGMASHCCDLEEKLSLLEESLGVALYAHPEEAERIIPHSTQTYDAIKAREEELRKRPNRYRLEAVQRDAWPAVVQDNLDMLEACLREIPVARINELLFHLSHQGQNIPHHPRQLLCRVSTAWKDGKWESALLALWDGEKKQLETITTRAFVAQHALWMTQDREPVMEQFAENGRGIGAIVCLRKDGSIKWRFAPDASIRYAVTSPEGIITLFSSDAPNETTTIWQVDGNTGALLRIVPWNDDLMGLYYLDDLSVYAAYTGFRGGSRTALLDQDFRLLKEYTVSSPAPDVAHGMRIGTMIYQKDLYKPRMNRFDLESGEVSFIPLEFDGCLCRVLPDGSMLSCDKPFCVYDAAGRIVSRHRLKGWLQGFAEERGQVYVVEAQGIPSHDFFTNEMAKQVKVLVWRLGEV